jgi:probable rRNA maturation factor
MPRISYFFEDTDFILKNKKKISNWISSAVIDENKKIVALNFIFCSDQYLLEINKSYLNHNTFTDIITFDNSEHVDEIEGDVFISIDRINENKNTFNVSFDKELHRVMIHGVLHLLGYEDKSEVQIRTMREKEEYYLDLFVF